MKGVFITGTSTAIGKTTYAKWLMERHPEATYWKPVQTGWPEDDDTATVAARLFLPGLRFKDPVSPHLAAEREGKRIRLEEILKPVREFEGTLVAEGAGGLLVPLAPDLMQTDLIQALELPAVVVARDELGTINHTLLTLEALRARCIEVRGVVLMGGEKNRESIERYGEVAVIKDCLEP
ncbi:MAG: dethiobiotin synthase [Deltaproteobacteria bacterium]|nr:dethiobiotin synthase [Deltaproteobacteria bacterium]